MVMWQTNTGMALLVLAVVIDEQTTPLLTCRTSFRHKYVMLAALASVVAFIFIPFFAPNLGVLEVGEIL
jgi:hypothetical protein